MKKLSNSTYKGTVDWLPAEFAVRKYIFDTWRDVCTRYGYQEYLTPLVEYADVYRAKSGEDVGGKELFIFTDKAGRELAIRPEMTPSVSRMVSKIYTQSTKPLRLFSIANFMRAEKPQRGRNREFWQLNFDIFGSDSIEADIEILKISLDIMLAFNPPEESFKIFLNDRQLIEKILEQTGAPADSITEVIRVLDKWTKLKQSEIEERLVKAGVTPDGIDIINLFMTSQTLEDIYKLVGDLSDSDQISIIKILESLREEGIEEYFEFKPSILRGFDYYNGMIFEVFDMNPENSRAMFGGGRYNGLTQLFGNIDASSVGCAPGDETTKLFLESWGLINDLTTSVDYYIPLLDQRASLQVKKIAQSLRDQGSSVIVGFEEQKIPKALGYANKVSAKKIVLLGSNELKEGRYTVKDLQSGEQESVSF